MIIGRRKMNMRANLRSIVLQLYVYSIFRFSMSLSLAVSHKGITGKNFEIRVIIINTIVKGASVINISVKVGVYTMKL